MQLPLDFLFIILGYLCPVHLRRRQLPWTRRIGSLTWRRSLMSWVVRMQSRLDWLCTSLRVMHLLRGRPMSKPKVANVARNYEILHERDDDDAERPDKRQKSDDRHQPTTQQSSHRNHGHNNDRHGSNRRGGGDNHHSNNNYSGNNRNSGNGRDQRNMGQQSNRSANYGNSL
nr:hypothetical protein [Tanacetum cinerariifolium]